MRKTQRCSALDLDAQHGGGATGDVGREIGAVAFEPAEPRDAGHQGGLRRRPGGERGERYESKSSRTCAWSSTTRFLRSSRRPMSSCAQQILLRLVQAQCATRPRSGPMLATSSTAPEATSTTAPTSTAAASSSPRSATASASRRLTLTPSSSTTCPSSRRRLWTDFLLDGLADEPGARRAGLGLSDIDSRMGHEQGTGRLATYESVRSATSGSARSSRMRSPTRSVRARPRG